MTMELKPILLVEDNLDDELLLLEALREANITNPVVVMRDGPEALDYLFGNGEHVGRDTSLLPQLILLDLKLRKMSGLEVLRRIRAHDLTHIIPVVVLSTSSEQEDMFQVYNNGANSYVRKPVEFERFTSVIRDLGSFWLLCNELPNK